VRLRDAVRTSAHKAPYVRRLFATIADRYDFVTVALSFGRDRHWKTRLVRMAGPLAGRRVVDLACGTGDITYLLKSAGARVIGLDITPRMIALAQEKSSACNGAVRPVFVVGDMADLPFPNAAFDVVTTGYGLRNVPELSRAISEIARVLRPGGFFLSLDFNRPENRLVRAVYRVYLTMVGSALGWVLHRDPDTYRYIPESIRYYPGARAVVRLLHDHGFREARWHPVLGGLMAIHSASRH
jgi:demethylmenaquinone methyltransferase/2-methoxy-6-polyprenyl-1,4-benzoquinol methylase